MLNFIFFSPFSFRFVLAWLLTKLPIMLSCFYLVFLLKPSISNNCVWYVISVLMDLTIMFNWKCVFIIVLSKVCKRIKSITFYSFSKNVDIIRLRFSLYIGLKFNRLWFIFNQVDWCFWKFEKCKIKFNLRSIFYYDICCTFIHSEIDIFNILGKEISIFIIILNRFHFII